MFNRTLLGVLALALTGLMVVGCQRHHNHSDADMAGYAAKALSLDAGQQARVTALVGEVRAAHEQVRQARSILMDELIVQMRADRVDPDSLASAIDQARSAADTALILLGNKVGEVHAMLTPEQRAKLAEKLAEHRSRHGDESHHQGWFR